METKATVDAKESSDASYFKSTCSFLHRITARIKILPYMDMVRWIISNVDISDRTFRNSTHTVMGSFKLDNLHQMSHLPEPQNIYDKASIEHFSKENEDPMDVMQNWRSDSNKFRWEKTSM